MWKRIKHHSSPQRSNKIFSLYIWKNIDNLQARLNLFNIQKPRIANIKTQNTLTTVTLFPQLREGEIFWNKCKRVSETV